MCKARFRWLRLMLFFSGAVAYAISEPAGAFINAKPFPAALRLQLLSKGLSRQASNMMILVLLDALSIFARTLPTFTQSYSVSFSLRNLASVGIR